MTTGRSRTRTAVIVHGILLVTVVVSVAATPNAIKRWVRSKFANNDATRVVIHRDRALQIAPLYDDPSVVSHDDLAMVLRKVRPTFPRKQLKPNHVEHALRTWGIDAKFKDPAVLSGKEMLDVLVDHGQYAASWDGESQPLLTPEADGVGVRWGPYDASGSVHHDHLLTSLSEAGVSLDETVIPRVGSPTTFGALLQQSIRDFRLDEKETEWSTMAFALWLAPETKSWRNSAGRTIDFSKLADRLMRGHAKYGVCSGTHRIYSLVVLWRLDAEHDLFDDSTRERVRTYLKRMRDVIAAAQFPDGHWASNWSQGTASVANPITEPDRKAVIATGHHLEWLAIAPAEFHPPRDVVRKGAKWLVKTVREKPQAQILRQYTFYSHVGNALALWRKTRPWDFWRSR